MIDTVGFVGLGAMGFPMARRLPAVASRVLLWNRTYQKAVDVAAAGPAEDIAVTGAAQQLGSMVAVARLEDLAECDVICMCLPTLVEVRTCCEKLAPLLTKKGVIILDHTSGAPMEAKQLHTELLALRHAAPILYVDAPVSGGPKGAAASELSNATPPGRTPPISNRESAREH